MASSKSFEKASAMLFCLLMSANVINYAYQVIMGYCLSVEDYGTLNAIQAVVTVASVPAGAFLMASSRASAGFECSSDEGQRLEFGECVSATVILSCVVGLALDVVGLLLSGVLANLFDISNSLCVAVGMLFVGFNCTYSALSGVLQGSKKLAAYGAGSIVSMAAKLLFSVLFIAVGVGLIGAVFGLVLSLAVSSLFCLALIYKLTSIRITKGSLAKATRAIKPLLRLVALQVLLSLFTNADVLLVKMFADASTAGVYSSGMVIAKIPLYVASALVGVLFPFVAGESVQKGNTLQLLRKALVYGVGIAVACCLLLVAFGGPIVDVLFGVRYAGAAGYLPVISAFAVSLTLFTVIANYAGAIDEMGFFNKIGAVGAIVTFLVIAFWHPGVEEIIMVLSAGLLVIGVGNLGRLVGRYGKIQKKQS